MEEPIVALKWSGVEAEFVPKSNNWYWTVGILSIGSAVASLIMGNFLFAVILLLAGFTTALLGTRQPAVHTFKITNRGIDVSGQTFPYQNIIKFAIVESEPKKLLFELKDGLVKVHTLPLIGIDHRKVRTELKNQNLEETEHLNTLTARLADWMGLG